MRDLGAAPPFLDLPYPTPVHSTTPAINRPLWGEKRVPFFLFIHRTLMNAQISHFGVSGEDGVLHLSYSLKMKTSVSKILLHHSSRQSCLPHDRTNTQPVPYQQLNLLCLPSDSKKCRHNINSYISKPPKCMLS